jgi:hypothetical protein
MKPSSVDAKMVVKKLSRLKQLAVLIAAINTEERYESTCSL